MAKEHKKRGRPRKTSTVSTESGVKRGRGRPRKTPVEVVVKRKRGRPRKIVSTESLASVPKRRGRPPKHMHKEYSRNGRGYKVEEIDLSKVKMAKFLGYCPKCQGIVSTLDYMDGKKLMIICSSCSWEGKEKDLFVDRSTGEQPKTRREFLESLMDLAGHDHVPSYDDDIPDELKATDTKEDDWE